MSRFTVRRSGCGLVLLVAIALLRATTITGQRGAAPETIEPPPRLVVVLVVDQMRADYVDRFQADWTSGLKRLFTQGARFTNAAHPYLETYTCAGHATVATGAFPHVHGIVQNTWYDRDRDAAITCTDDPAGEPVTYGSGRGRSDGPGRLLIPTLADEMRTQRSARVVTLALKARSAIMMAGHGGDAVTWLTDTLDAWQTSKAFAVRQVPEVKTYVERYPISTDYGKVWSRMLPPAHYPEPDAGEAEAAPEGWTTTFPHPLFGKNRVPDPQFRDLWQYSPFANAYIGRMAAALTQNLRLGTRGTTDVLAVSFSSTDLVGHQFGPTSQEVRDMYAQLDRTIGLLLDRLDSVIGRDLYVVALTADHGVTEIPEQLRMRGLSAGRLIASTISSEAQKAAETVLGPGRYVARVVSNDIYFHPGVYDRLRQQPGALDAVTKTLAGHEGINRVLRREELANPDASNDPIVRAAALSYVSGRSGDLILATKPGWMFSVEGTTHGSMNPDDQRVPLVLMGHRIKAGTYTDAVTPADVAPTLATIAGISLPRAEGRALAVAIDRARSTR
jgi:predicted AlkP superfamily pyrophosphatase or phosphodiesterase